MADSKKNGKGKSGVKKESGFSAGMKKFGAKTKSAAGCVLDWFRNHPVISHMLAIGIVIVCLIVLVYVSMTLGTRHNAERTVPNFVGLSVNDADRFATRRDLEIIVSDSLYEPDSPRGVVLDQIPRGGMIVKPGRKIYVTINSLYQRRAEVPYVVGLSLRDAKSKLETAGFTIASLQYVEDIATDYVLAEFVNGEKVSSKVPLQATIGSGVVLKLGVQSSQRGVVVPDVNGLSLPEAKSRICIAGLNVGKITFDKGISMFERSETRVHSQTPAANTSVGRGSTVALSLGFSRDDAESVAVQ